MYRAAEDGQIRLRVGLGQTALQANATFGKTMENVRQRVNLRLIADSDKLLKATGKASFRHSQIINSDLVLVRAARQKVTLNKPIAADFLF